MIFLFQPILWGSGSVETAESYLKREVITKKLNNGITLIMLDRGFAPTMALNISFRVGSSNESYRTIGAAHMLEHMLFKGTDKIGTRDFEREKVILRKIEAIGETIDELKRVNPDNDRIPELKSRLKELQKQHQQYVVSSPYDRIYTMNGGVGFNASTSRDKTGYYIELPSSKLELWARLESERLRRPVLREFYLERNNVMQERLMRYDSSGTGLLSERFIASAFEAHPYRHPIIGWKSSIANLSIRDIRAFYYANYIPSRMTITVVGKQDVEETYRIVSTYFGNIEPRPEPRKQAIAEPVKRGEKRFTVSFESEPYLMMGWHKPTFPSRDDYVLDVIAQYLAGGKSSPLYKALVLEKKLASSISAWNGYPGARYNNLFVISGAPAGSYTTGELEKEIYSVMDRALSDISDEDIKRVIVSMESDLVFSLDANKGLAHMLSYYQTVFNKWEYLITYVESIRSISVREVKDAAKKYFTSTNRIVGILKDSRKEKTNTAH